MKKFAVIVAGGSGSRMNSDTPKQFIQLMGSPILMHTIAAFYRYDATIQLIVVLPENQVNIWKGLVQEYQFKVAHSIVIGGITRFDSVQNGINAIKEDGLVAIHDGARPLVTAQVIEQSYQMAALKGSGVASVKLKDSIRKVDTYGNKSVNREDYYIIQTPQTFRITLIKRAFQKVTTNQFTDDASVLEASGEKVFLTKGDYQNIKVTTPEDLMIAESFLRKK